MKKEVEELMDQAVELFQHEKDHEALELINKAIELDQESTDLFYQKSVILYELNLYQESLEAAERAISLDDTSAEAYFMKGIISYEQENYDVAREAFEKVVFNNPEHDVAYGYLGELYLNVYDEAEKALEIFDKVLSLDGNAVDIHFNKGIAHLNLGNIESAVQDFEKVLELEPEDEEAKQILSSLQSK